MELKYWTGSEFAGGSYDETAKRWSVLVRLADGTTREMHPRHVVMATGVSGIPSVPDVPRLRNFRGEILHSSEYEGWRGLEGKDRSRHRLGQQRP